MKIEVLLATMFFENEPQDNLDQMNIKTDIIIGNQCDKNEDVRYMHGENSVTVLSRAERGVGKNRNLTLDNSTADVVLFADNDVKYYNDYAEKIERFYNTHPDADMVIFNFKESRDGSPLLDIVSESKKAKLKDATRYGAFAITIKNESLKKTSIRFSLDFGGGAKYGSGEDSLFIADCFRNKLKVYLCSDTLGEVVHRESTWYKGVTEKYIFDKGALFKAMCPKIYRLVIIRHVLKYRRLYSTIGRPCKIYKLMIKGAKDYINK